MGVGKMYGGLAGSSIPRVGSGVTGCKVGTGVSVGVSVGGRVRVGAGLGDAVAVSVGSAVAV